MELNAKRTMQNAINKSPQPPTNIDRDCWVSCIPCKELLSYTPAKRIIKAVALQITTPEKINTYKDIVLGKDGIILQKDGHSAVFLPQVATEQGWNLEETLKHLSRKAFLPSDSWKDASFMIFQVEKFKMPSNAPLKAQPIKETSLDK